MPILRVEAEFVSPAEGSRLYFVLDFVRVFDDETYKSIMIQYIPPNVAPFSDNWYVTFKGDHPVSIPLPSVPFWGDPPGRINVLLQVVKTTGPDGSIVVEVDLPEEVYSEMQDCDWAFYEGSRETHGMRGFLDGGLLFDSADPDPDPYEWGSAYASQITWDVTPGFFWTQRRLCEETKS